MRINTSEVGEAIEVKAKWTDSNEGCKYSAIFVDWTKTGLAKIDWRTRKQINMNREVHPRAEAARLYLHRKEDGR